MSHIIYMTTAMDSSDFNEYLVHWSSPPNPSNQNFHNKLIRSLAINNKVDVISVRPFSRSLCNIKHLKKSDREDGNISWHYIPIQRNLFQKIILGQTHVNDLMKKLATPDSIIFVDTINPSIVHFAKHALKNRNLKIVGICTDSPSNISGTSRSYTTYLLSHTNNYSGYIALTSGLNELFNPNNFPSLITEGIVFENAIEKKTELGKYFFFGGALLPRYGVYDLIKGFQLFKKSKKGYKLFIAGHHGNKRMIEEAIGEDENIVFLNGITIEESLAYQKGAIANINPRPFSEDLDRYSVPSKTLEYLTSGNPTLSVKNSKLQKSLGDHIIWIKSSSAKNIDAALKHVVSLTKAERSSLGQKAEKKVLELYSLQATNEKVNDLLKRLS
ncbi:MAG: glycosyltransferase [Erysipelotrichia bacterium]|nr:glycosyltransferase [Erysipelotrichia bacterium]